MPASMSIRRLIGRLADPAAALALIAALSGTAHLISTRLLDRGSAALYSVFFFSAAAALIISGYRLFLRGGRRRGRFHH